MKGSTAAILGGALIGALAIMSAGAVATQPRVLAKAGRVAQRVADVIYPFVPLGGLPHISSHYGWRGDPMGSGQKFHAGLDLQAAEGTPLHAPLDGIITRLDYAGTREDGSPKPNGNAIFLQAGDHRWVFLHLSRFNVTVGDVVYQGDVIGWTGNTGRTTGPHLHMQVYDVLGKTIDPESLFPAGSFENMRAMA